MSTNDPARRVPPSETKRLYWSVDPDMTDEEIDAWADQFVDAVLGDLVDTEREADS